MSAKIRTKIVATIGPASQSVAKLEKMIRSGLRVARLNFSHGTYKNHAVLVRNIRAAAKRVGVEVAILQDLQGPRIRVGDVAEEGVAVKRGDKVVLVKEGYSKKISGFTMISIQYENLYRDVKPGTAILIEDGTIRLEVLKVKDTVIHCKVKIGGIIRSYKGINVPGTTLTVDVITEKDKKDLAFGQKQEVDFVALSFVKDAGDIKRLKNLIKKYQKPGVTISTKTIAKIERQEALDNLDQIINEVDGVMIARGDLAIEVSAQEVPLWQKGTINKCLLQAKPVIVATQMLDSMIKNPQPTRAEVSDVANAIIDHTDGIMLSGESATGKYPVEAVVMMNKIATVTEKSSFDDYLCGPKKVRDSKSALSYAACQIHLNIGAKAMIVLTKTGDTARQVSRHRPELTILALTPERKTQRQLALSWGVISKNVLYNSSLPSMVEQGIKFLKQQKIVKKGDFVIVAGSDPFGKIPALPTVQLVKVEK